MAKTLDQIIEENLKLGKPKIGFGLKEKDEKIIESIKKVKDCAEIVIVGPTSLEKIEDFECILSENPEEKLAQMLFNQEVDGIVRGTIDDFKTHEAYIDLIGKERAEKERELSLLEDAHGRQFFISEASNPGGWTVEEKIKGVEGIIDFMKQLGMIPKIGVLTGVRHETYQRRKDIKEGVIGILNKTYEDAQEIVKYFTEKGYQAKNYAIELNAAVEDSCNIIVPVNGMVGNQIFRALCLIGGGKILIASRANLPHVYEDNSRNEKDFSYHIKWAAAWANSKKHQKA
jgi:predicted methyltransferase MtxX (methanogen marker protein 4)